MSASDQQRPSHDDDQRAPSRPLGTDMPDSMMSYDNQHPSRIGGHPYLRAGANTDLKMGQRAVHQHYTDLQSREGNQPFHAVHPSENQGLHVSQHLQPANGRGFHTTSNLPHSQSSEMIPKVGGLPANGRGQHTFPCNFSGANGRMDGVGRGQQSPSQATAGGKKFKMVRGIPPSSSMPG